MKAKRILFNQSLNSEKCINFFVKYGYFIHREDENNIIMKKNGTIFSFKGEKFPKELTIHFNSRQTEISLKYDAFVLFDTGDLQDEVNLLSHRINQNINNFI